MSVIATFSIPADDFTLGRMISGNSEARVRFERLIPIGDSFIPYLWADDDSVQTIEDNLRNEPDITAVEVVDKANDRALVRVEWAEEADGLREALAETDANILEGLGVHDSWRFQLRFDDHERLSEFYRSCAAKGISLDVEAVHDPDINRPLGIIEDLTDAQIDSLEIALKEGYFDVPRRINLVELAEQIGISDSALSQRLRRGVATVLDGTPLRFPDERE